MPRSFARSPWPPRIGWTLLALVFALFVWGLERRADLEAQGESVIRMLFVPSVEQGTLVRRGEDLARFVREDSGLVLRSEVPTSYAAVVQALGAGQADVAWMPAFAYELARARYGAEVRLQVVRSVDRFAVVITRSGPGQPEDIEALAARRVALPRSLTAALRAKVVARLDARAPGWVEVPVESDLEAVRRLVESPLEVDGAVSSHVFSGPSDLVGDGRKELEGHRPGTLLETRIVDTTEAPVAEPVAHYYGCIYTRSDSPYRRIADLHGRRFAFSDETSTSGAIFPRLLLDRHGVALGRVYYAGGHPNAVQAVWDGKADAGAAFYSPPSAQHARDGTLVGDARHLVMRRISDPDARRRFLDEVRVLALTDPIPNDVCVVRRGFPARTWERFAGSLDRFIATPEGQLALYDLVAAIGVAPADDEAFRGFRQALAVAGIRIEDLMAAEEQKLANRRGQATPPPVPEAKAP